MNIIDNINIKLKFDLATATQGTFCERVDNCLSIDREDGRTNYFLNERGQWVIVQGGGGSVCAENGLSIDPITGCVILGGTLDRNTEINGTDDYYIMLGDILHGGDSLFVYGNLFDLTGDDEYGLIVYGETIQIASPGMNSVGVFNINDNAIDFLVGNTSGTPFGQVFITETSVQIGATSGNGSDENAMFVNDTGVTFEYYNSLTGDLYRQGLNDNGIAWSNDAIGALANIFANGDVEFAQYPETRDDSATFTPTNFLYTDAVGTILSAPLSGLIGGVQSVTGLQVDNTDSANPIIRYPDPTTMRTVLWTDLTGWSGSVTSLIASTGTQAIEFGDWSIFRSGTNTTTSLVTGEAGRSGIVALGAAGVGTFVSLRALNIWIGAAKRFKTAVRLPILSTSGQEYVVRCGDTSSSNDANQSVYFRYTQGTNGGRWQFITRTNTGAETIIDTGVTVVAGDWYVLDYYCTNAGMTLNWSINGSIPQQVTTNVEINYNAAINVAIAKTNGNTARVMDVDFAYYHYNR